jgi:hypothetical protein
LGKLSGSEGDVTSMGELRLRGESDEPVGIASILVCIAKDRPSSVLARIEELPDRFECASSADGWLHVAYRRRSTVAGDDGRSGAFPPLLILGDPSDVEGRTPRAMGNAAAIACDLDAGRLDATASIPGLPALYLAETAAAIVLTSDLALLSCVAGLSLHFDPAGVTDLARVGWPVEHRTLFAGVRIVPGGSRLSLCTGKRPAIETAWTPPERDPLRSWDEYTALQADAFDRSLSRLDVKGCSFSLSGGIDSRTTFAGLVARGAKVSALTVCGETDSLDARTAAKLCAAYGMPHRTIRLDDAFRRSLPDLCARASRLCGGIGSVWHAAQVHCYEQLGAPPPVGALSGYLGNQIGRRGTEQLSLRNASTAILDRSLVDARDGQPAWYAHAIGADGLLAPRFLIQQESTFGNLASYSIGSACSIQQSAYADRSLIESLWRMPEASSRSPRSARLANLEHLFLGEPVLESFQRQYIRRIGGVAASLPVNWGWRARGGVSARGIAWGALALLDVVVSGRRPHGAAADLLAAAGIAGLHEFRPVDSWMRRDLKECVHDLVLSRQATEAGIFEAAALEHSLRDFYSDGRGGREVVLALDLALAAREFGATA